MSGSVMKKAMLDLRDIALRSAERRPAPTIVANAVSATRSSFLVYSFDSMKLIKKSSPSPHPLPVKNGERECTLGAEKSISTGSVSLPLPAACGEKVG